MDARKICLRHVEPLTTLAQSRVSNLGSKAHRPIERRLHYDVEGELKEWEKTLW